MEMDALKDKTNRQLLETGITQEALFDGGMEVWRPWYGKKKTGKQVWYRLTVKHQNIDLINSAVSSLEPLLANQRYSFTLDMKQPVFKPEADGVEKALKQAYANASQKARILALSAGVTLGGVLQIEELSKAKRNSGAYGDEDYWGDEGRYGGTGGIAFSGAAEKPAIRSPKRTVWLRYRIRFEVMPKDSFSGK